MLSTETIKHLLNDSTFTKVDGCVKLLNKTLNYRVNSFYKSSSIYQTSRYCSQKYFKLLICGGFNSDTLTTSSNVNFIDLNKVEDGEAYPPMITGRRFLKLICLKGDVYVYGGRNKNGGWINFIDKYSLTSKKWSQVSEMNDYREYFCVCAFMDKIFIIEGHKGGSGTNSCLQFLCK